MARIKGITVTLIDKAQSGKDPFGNPIYSEVEKMIDNVLVVPTSTDDITNNLELEGKKAAYTLAIPKNDMNTWENKEVRFFGQRWRVFGKTIQGIDHLIPLSWNKKVMVEAYE